MRILLLEDEEDLNRIIVKKLKIEGYTVDTCFDGEEALNYLVPNQYDLIISDIMMPKKDGYEFLKEIRTKGDTTPFLLLTARDDIDDKIKGFNLGADDYLVKPFHFDELIARIRAMIRRNHGIVTNEIMVADLTLDIGKRTVVRDGKNIQLSTKEFAILEYLIQNKGNVVSRQKLENHIWNYDYQGGSNMIDVYIKNLRMKMDKDFKVKLIHTVRGIGYVLKENEN